MGNTRNDGLANVTIAAIIHDIGEWADWTDAGHGPTCIDLQEHLAAIVDAFTKGREITGDLASAFSEIAECPICWHTLVATTEALGGRVPDRLASPGRLHAVLEGFRRALLGVKELVAGPALLPSPSLVRSSARKTSPGVPPAGPDKGPEAIENGSSGEVSFGEEVEVGLSSRRAGSMHIVWFVAGGGEAVLQFPRIEDGSGKTDPAQLRLQKGQAVKIRFTEDEEDSRPGARHIVHVSSLSTALDRWVSDWLAGPRTGEALFAFLASRPEAEKRETRVETHTYLVKPRR